MAWRGDNVDVLMGGGADYFLPVGVPGGKRKDGKDVIAAFRAKGYQVARNTAELNAATGTKLLGLFADVGNLWLDPRLFRLLDLRPNVGAGLRFGGLGIEGRYVYGFRDLKLASVTDPNTYKTRTFLILVNIGRT